MIRTNWSNPWRPNFTMYRTVANVSAVSELKFKVIFHNSHCFLGVFFLQESLLWYPQASLLYKTLLYQYQNQQIRVSWHELWTIASESFCAKCSSLISYTQIPGYFVVRAAILGSAVHTHSGLGSGCMQPPQQTSPAHRERNWTGHVHVSSTQNQYLDRDGGLRPASWFCLPV